MKCNNCGSEIKEGAKFCGKCGASLNDGGSYHQYAKISSGQQSPTPNKGKKTFIPIVIIGAVAGAIVLVLALSGVFGIFSLSNRSTTQQTNEEQSGLPIDEEMSEVLAAEALASNEELENNAYISQEIQIQVREEYVSNTDGEANIYLEIKNLSDEPIKDVLISEENYGEILLIDELGEQTENAYYCAVPNDEYMFMVDGSTGDGEKVSAEIPVSEVKSEIIGRSNSNDSTVVFQDGILTASAADLSVRDEFTTIEGHNSSLQESLFKVEMNLQATNAYTFPKDQYGLYGVADNVNMIGNILYYTELMNIRSVDIATNESELKYSGENDIEYLLCTDSFVVWYEGGYQEGKLYKADIDFSNKTLLFDFSTNTPNFENFNYSNGKIYYYHDLYEGVDSVYEFDIDSKENKLLFEKEDIIEVFASEQQEYRQMYTGIDGDMLVDKGNIYYLHLIEGEWASIESLEGTREIRKYDIDTGEDVLLSTTAFYFGDALFIDDGLLYYKNDNYDLCRMNPEAPEEQEILFEGWGDYASIEGGNNIIMGVSHYTYDDVMEGYEIINIQTGDVVKVWIGNYVSDANLYDLGLL